MNAILGTSEACIAVHPSDMCVALRVLDAMVHVAGPQGERTIPIADFHRLPGDTPERDTNLEANEIITAVELPAKGFADQLHLHQDPRPALLRLRARFDRRGDGDRGRHDRGRAASRLAASRTSRGARRRRRRSSSGKAPDDEAFGRAAEVLLRDARGFEHNAFKIELARRGNRARAEAGGGGHAAIPVQQESAVRNPMVTDVSRRDVLQGAVAFGTLGYAGRRWRRMRHRRRRSGTKPGRGGISGPQSPHRRPREGHRRGEIRRRI